MVEFFGAFIGAFLGVVGSEIFMMWYTAKKLKNTALEELISIETKIDED